MSSIKQELLEKALSLPLSPGVYIMKDKDGRIIYIGKSRSLKMRVSQYFREGTHQNSKTSLMLSRVSDFEYIITDTENEALMLENRLIKQHSPKYNIKLKDGKRDPYLKMTTGKPYPVLVHCWHVTKDGSKYFGPFSSSSFSYALKKNTEKLFSLPSCKRVFPRDIGKERPCLYYHIGQCCGVCTGKVSEEEYAGQVNNAMLFLNGNISEIKKELKREMEKASQEMRYEKAASYRDKIDGLQKLTERQKVVTSPDVMSDAIALYSGDAVSCLTVFSIRGGLLSDSEHHFFTLEQPADSGAITAFLTDLYMKKSTIPPEILICDPLEEEDIQFLSEFLTEKAGKKVSVKIPVKGDKKSLCEMVRENAERHALLHISEYERDNMTLVRLASLLKLEVLPERIESYDISNYGSDNITAGMVVFESGRPKKSAYRLFKIKRTARQDDYSSMREAVERRLERYSNGDKSFSPLPDLILLDGGKGHVNAIKPLIIERGLDIPVFGMVKDNYHKTRTLCGDREEINIALEKSVFTLIYNIQEEVHSFAYRSMARAKSKSYTRSSLEKINGIGPKKAKILLSHFGSISGIKKADKEEITAVKGISAKDAEEIVRFYGKTDDAAD